MWGVCLTSAPPLLSLYACSRPSVPGSSSLPDPPWTPERRRDPSRADPPTPMFDFYSHCVLRYAGRRTLSLIRCCCRSCCVVLCFHWWAVGFARRPFSIKLVYWDFSSPLFIKKVLSFCGCFIKPNIAPRFQLCGNLIFGPLQPSAPIHAEEHFSPQI